MNRRNMILTLASAALIPATRALANSGFAFPGHPSCDRKLAATITALERASWEAFKNWDAKTWDAIYADQFFEVLVGGVVLPKELLLPDIINKVYETEYEMSEIFVLGIDNDTALIRYRLYAELKLNGEPLLPVTDAYVVSSYAKVRGRWKGFSYQETAIV